ILPSLSPDLEDVVVRGVVRRDFELSGMYDVIPDAKAPAGMYGFEDPVDVPAWRNIGAEVVIKVAARKRDGKVEISGLAYFLSHGADPVYQKKLVVGSGEVRLTAHRLTDALLGALTGRDGGFASHMTYVAPWGHARRVFTMDADGHDLTPRSNDKDTAIAPTWGAGGTLFYASSHEYSPFSLFKDTAGTPEKVNLPFSTSIYGVSFDDKTGKMAVAVAEGLGSAIYVGNADGTGLQKVSNTEIATHPVWSPSGKLAWVGGGGKQGTQRIYVDGKPASPSGFAASSPVFCDTEDGIRLVFTVSVAGDRQDLVMTNERGGGIARLTQDQGSNTYPACSVDGRLLAFFSTRKSGQGPGMYLLSLKRWKTQRLSGQTGESLRWAPLPK
ncbi:MAG TPA: tolB protein, partial [Polyangiaceae bacterium]|nr:tolB protein [Polyangiaceae bacterium]